MAHMARAAGTDYAVAGGKTLIDGTAYSVVATREVEKTVAVSGRFTGNTIENEAFDWNKYQINSIAIKGPNTNGYLTALFRTPGLSDYIETFETGRPSIIGWPPVFDTSQNGKLGISITNNYLTVSGGRYVIILEAKT